MLAAQLAGCAYHLNNGRSSGLSGAQNVIDEAEKAGISRMILVTSLGAAIAGHFYRSEQRLRLVRRSGKNAGGKLVANQPA